MGYFIIKLLILLSIFISSCGFILNNKYTEPQIIKVKEMEAIKEFENSIFTKTANIKDLNIEYLRSFKNIIKDNNLYDISKWALKEMKDYKLPDNFMDKLELDGVYKKDKNKIYFFKSIDLPTHSPLVNRFLYIGFDYNNNKLEKIIITIQGYAEE